MFVVDEAVVIKPRRNFGDVKEVISDAKYKVKCRVDCDENVFPEFDLCCAIPGKWCRIPIDENNYYKGFVEKNLSGELGLFLIAISYQGHSTKEQNRRVKWDMKKFKNSK